MSDMMIFKIVNFVDKKFLAFCYLITDLNFTVYSYFWPFKFYTFFVKKIPNKYHWLIVKGKACLQQGKITAKPDKSIFKSQAIISKFYIALNNIYQTIANSESYFR